MMKELIFKVTLNPVHTVYHPVHAHQGSLERPVFDRDYVNRLTQGDPEIERHFTCYFGDLLVIKLRSRLHSKELIEDACQETFLQVLCVLRNKGGIQYPDRLGAFVNSVCEHVLAGFFRTGGRYQQVPENAPDPADQAANAESQFISEERKTIIRTVLGKLSHTDQVILRKVFLEERDKNEICQELGLQRVNLRVRIHRALLRLRAVVVCDEHSALGSRRTLKALTEPLVSKWVTPANYFRRERSQ
jgi:RNA polymerase sigma-70 factor (ECF subfamily)